MVYLYTMFRVILLRYQYNTMVKYLKCSDGSVLTINVSIRFVSFCFMYDDGVGLIKYKSFSWDGFLGNKGI